MTTAFWADILRPDGSQVRVEAASYRAVVWKIRFCVAVESARLLERGPVPENVKHCTRCRDLFVPEHEADSVICVDCLEELLD
jgi:hypothetical protein